MNEKETPKTRLELQFSAPRVAKWDRTSGYREGSGTMKFEDMGDQGTSGKKQEKNPRINLDRRAEKPEP